MQVFAGIGGEYAQSKHFGGGKDNDAYIETNISVEVIRVGWIVLAPLPCFHCTIEIL